MPDGNTHKPVSDRQLHLTALLCRLLGLTALVSKHKARLQACGFVLRMKHGCRRMLHRSHAMLWHAVVCCAMLCHAVPCCTMLQHAVPRCARTLSRYTAVGLFAGSASKQLLIRACRGGGSPSGRGGACLATPTAVQICMSVSCCQGGEPVIMCSRVAAKPQMSTLLLVRLPGANCSGDLQGPWKHVQV